MNWLVDSDDAADWLKGIPDATTLLTQLAPDGLAISIITSTEVYEGIYYGRTPTQYERIFRQFVRGITVIGVNCSIARQCAYPR